MLMLLMTAFEYYDVTFCEFMNVKNPEVFLSSAWSSNFLGLRYRSLGSKNSKYTEVEETYRNHFSFFLESAIGIFPKAIQY